MADPLVVHKIVDLAGCFSIQKTLSFVLIPFTLSSHDNKAGNQLNCVILLKYLRAYLFGNTRTWRLQLWKEVDI